MRRKVKVGHRARYFGLVTLAVVLQTPGPLAVTALVVSPVALRSVLPNLRFKSIGISVKALFDGPMNWIINEWTRQNGIDITFASRPHFANYLDNCCSYN